MTDTFGKVRGDLMQLPDGVGVARDIINRFINNRIDQYCRAFPWTRLRQQSILQTVPEYTDGTISIAAGATSGTGTDTVFTTAMTGRLIRIVERLEFYEFTRVSATTFTIDRAYEGTEDVTDGSYRIWQPIYELPEELAELKEIVSLTHGFPLGRVERSWLDQNAASRFSYGPPSVYAPAEDSADGIAQIELYPGPIESEGLPIDWKAKAPHFEDEDTGVEFPDWVSIPAIFVGVEADLADLKGNTTRNLAKQKDFVRLSEEAHGEDVRKMPPIIIQMADRFNVQRFKRATGNSARTVRNWRAAGST